VSATFTNDDVLSITSIPLPLLILLLGIDFRVFVADESPQELLGGKFGIIGKRNGDADSGQRLAHEVSLRHAGRERIQLHALNDVGVGLAEEEFSGAADGTTLQVGFVDSDYHPKNRLKQTR